MFGTRQRFWLVPLIIGILIVICDQVSKYWVVQTLGPQPCYPNQCRAIALIGDWFNIVYSQNTGVAFGLLRSLSPILTVVSLLISAGAIYVYAVYLPKRSWIVQVSIGLIVGGAMGNIIDRMRLGYVVDFIQVGWWPVFNVADSAITVGATLLAFYLMFMPEEHMESSNPQDEALLSDLLGRDVGGLEHDRNQ